MQLDEAFLGVAVAQSMGTFGPSQYPLGGRAEGVGPALPSSKGVVLLVVDAAIRDRAGGFEALLFEMLGEVRRDTDLADEAAFADDGVGNALSAFPFAAEGRSDVGGLFT